MHANVARRGGRALAHRCEAAAAPPAPLNRTDRARDGRSFVRSYCSCCSTRTGGGGRMVARGNSRSLAERAVLTLRYSVRSSEIAF